jgi:hypothetical protein
MINEFLLEIKSNLSIPINIASCLKI